MLLKAPSRKLLNGHILVLETKLVFGKTNIILACPEARIQEVVIPNCGMTDEELFPKLGCCPESKHVGDSQ